jgi:hypothetical protein
MPGPRHSLGNGGGNGKLVAADGPPDLSYAPEESGVPWWLAFVATGVALALLGMFFALRYVMRRRAATATGK